MKVREYTPVHIAIQKLLDADFKMQLSELDEIAYEVVTFEVAQEFSLWP